MNLKNCYLKIDASCEASVNVQHIAQNAMSATEFARCHHLTQPWQCNSQKTRNTTPLKCCACHAKWRWGLQSAAPATKNGTHLLKATQKYCACHKERLSTRYETCWNVTKCHAPPRETRLRDIWNLQKRPLCRTRHRHGHGDLAQTVADGCGRLRTVADVNATSSEHTLNPQTPRMKREPLLQLGKIWVWPTCVLRKRCPKQENGMYWLDWFLGAKTGGFGSYVQGIG